MVNSPSIGIHGAKKPLSGLSSLIGQSWFLLAIQLVIGVMSWPGRAFRSDGGKSLNTQFVAIKVDRESQPEVDAFCIQVLLKLQGDAGWPANVFMSPKSSLDGWHLLSCCTISMVSRGLQMCFENVHSLWTQGPERFSETGHHIIQNFLSQPAENTEIRFIATQWERSSMNAMAALVGGRSFPWSPKRLDFMLAHLHTPSWLDALRRHLDAIDHGGIHDHIGGGFHRYAIDVDWSVPHYEKMLCDNAHFPCISRGHMPC